MTQDITTALRDILATSFEISDAWGDDGVTRQKYGNAIRNGLSAPITPHVAIIAMQEAVLRYTGPERSILKSSLLACSKRNSELVAALLSIAHMDCYTRDGEDLPHTVMMRIAKAALDPAEDGA